MHINWQAWVSDEEARRRAAGRLKFDEQRREEANQRRSALWEAFFASGRRWGWQTRLAVQLGVHRSTISRDVALVRAELGLLARRHPASRSRRLAYLPPGSGAIGRRGSRQAVAQRFK